MSKILVIDPGHIRVACAEVRSNFEMTQHIGPTDLERVIKADLARVLAEQLLPLMHIEKIEDVREFATRWRAMVAILPHDYQKYFQANLS